MAKSVFGSVVPGVASEVEAPGGLRRFFRFSQLAFGEAGGVRNIEDIWATVLKELRDSGLPDEAISRIESLGADKALGWKTQIPREVVALAGGPANVQAVKETMNVARMATKGVSVEVLESQVERTLNVLAKDPRFREGGGPELIAQLRKVDPRVLAEQGINQPISIMARRGNDPFVVGLYRKALKRSPTATLPPSIEEVFKQAAGGKLPKVTKAARKALAPSVKGAGAGASAVRKGLGFLGRGPLGALGVGAIAAMEVSRASDILGRSGRAKKQALAGFQELGASSSVEFLRDNVRQQEAVARRKTVMQRFEPELFQEVIRILGDTGQSKNTLTSTERRIGTNAQVGAQARGREPEDVEFLLDQLFSQLGQ